MKKLILSVLFGLLTGFIYLALMMFIATPFLILIRMGFIEMVTGGASVEGVIANLTGSMADITGGLGTASILIISVQAFLFVLMGVVTYIFLSKVMKVFLEDDAYFRHLYDAVFIAVMIIPEVLIVMAIFFKFPIEITICIILGITILIFIFSTVMACKVLPDLMKNKNRKYILKTK